jgi:hypothetical protein
MPDSFDGMTDLEHPVTRRELRHELAALEARLVRRVASRRIASNDLDFV